MAARIVLHTTHLHDWPGRLHFGRIIDPRPRHQRWIIKLGPMGPAHERRGTVLSEFACEHTTRVGILHVKRGCTPRRTVCLPSCATAFCDYHGFLTGELIVALA